MLSRKNITNFSTNLIFLTNKKRTENKLVNLVLIGQKIRENSKFLCVVKHPLRRLKKENKYLDNEKKKTAEIISNQLGAPLSKSNFLLLI